MRSVSFRHASAPALNTVANLSFRTGADGIPPPPPNIAGGADSLPPPPPVDLPAAYDTVEVSSEPSWAPKNYLEKSKRYLLRRRTVCWLLAEFVASQDYVAIFESYVCGIRCTNPAFAIRSEFSRNVFSRHPFYDIVSLDCTRQLPRFSSQTLPFRIESKQTEHVSYALAWRHSMLFFTRNLNDCFFMYVPVSLTKLAEQLPWTPQFTVR